MTQPPIDTMEELNAALPDKHQVAEELGIPLDQGHNEELTTSQVGKIGGQEEKMAKNSIEKAANHKAEK